MLTRREPDMTSKPGACPIPGTSLQAYSECCAGGVRRKVGATRYQALSGNYGNQSSRC